MGPFFFRHDQRFYVCTHPRVASNFFFFFSRSRRYVLDASKPRYSFTPSTSKVNEQGRLDDRGTEIVSEYRVVLRGVESLPQCSSPVFVSRSSPPDTNLTGLFLVTSNLPVRLPSPVKLLPTSDLNGKRVRKQDVDVSPITLSGRSKGGREPRRGRGSSSP